MLDFSHESELRAVKTQKKLACLSYGCIALLGGSLYLWDRGFCIVPTASLAFSKEEYWVERQLHLSLGYYHFCWAHGGLQEEIIPPIPTKGSGSPKKRRQVTPAMAIGVTDHKWTLQELLTFRVPPGDNSIVKGH